MQNKVHHLFTLNFLIKKKKINWKLIDADYSMQYETKQNQGTTNYCIQYVQQWHHADYSI